MLSPKLSGHREKMAELDVLIRSSRPLIYICTFEERRVISAIKALAERDKNPWTVLSWDVADLLKAVNEFSLPSNKLSTPGAVLSWFREADPFHDDGYMILLLKDFQKLIGSESASKDFLQHQAIRLLRNLADEFMNMRKTLIIIGTELYLPAEIEKIAAVVDWPLPEPVDIDVKLREMLAEASTMGKDAKGWRLNYEPQELADICQAFRGLTLDQIELATTTLFLTKKELDFISVGAEKRSVIRKSGLLDWIEVTEDMNNVGGLSELKRWLRSRKSSFSDKAIAYGLPNPKGVLMVGIQGAGKSLASKAISSLWGLPLLRLDMGKIFGSYQGESERNIRAVMKVAESVAPCILWVDELDKGMSGTGSSDRTDGGTTARVFGTFLTWMQEKTAPVFLVATANDVTHLPPELLRKGRFDEIFFVDLPSSEERSDIFSIHLTKRGRKPADFDIDRLAGISKSMTGAEIEAAIVSAMYDAFDDDGREINMLDIERAIAEMVPLAVTMKERIEELRDWASTRARSASTSNVKIQTRKEGVTETINSVMAGIDVDEEL